MSVHQLKIISDFLYVCQSVCCLTSLLKLGYLWISPVLDELSYSNFLETFMGCLYDISTYFQISCMFVSLFTASLPYLQQVNFGYLWFWMPQLSQIFWRHSWDVSTLVPNNFRFLVCLSVCSLPHFLTEMKSTLDISGSKGAILSNFRKIFLGCLYIGLESFYISCMSISLFNSSLPY